MQGAFRRNLGNFRADYTILPVVCPLCGTRKARRGCPALDKQICPICCGTKRLVEIPCPADCAWLASAREHPPAVFVRQQQRDLTQLVQFMRDLDRRQSQLFFLINTFIKEYQPPDLHAPVDDDVVEAADALAATYETAARGVIYEHRAQSLPAERLATALKPLLADAGKGLGSAFERDAAVVLRRVSAAAREVKAHEPQNKRAFLELLQRVMRPSHARDAASGDRSGEDDGPKAPARSGLILP